MKFGQKEMISIILTVVLIVFGILLLLLSSDDVYIPILAGIYKGVVAFYFSKRTVEEVMRESKKKQEGGDSTNAYERPFVDIQFIIRGIFAIITIVFLIPAFLIPSQNRGIFLENALVVIESLLISAGIQRTVKSALKE